jgi:hypothetical protein
MLIFNAKDMQKRYNKSYIMIALVLLLVTPGNSQDSQPRNPDITGVSSDCGLYLSGYREFFKIKVYEMAKQPWAKAFDNCPGASQRMYVDGVSLYRSFIEDAPEGPVREGLIDTLLLIYDRRMEHFGDEGNVLGRKGIDQLTYRGGEMDQVQDAYETLKKSIEIEGSDSREPVMLAFLTAGIMLNRENMLETPVIFDDYAMLSGLLDSLEKRSPRWERSRKKMNEMLLKEGILSCETLEAYYATHIEQNKDNKDYLEKAIALHDESGCNRSDVYVTASEYLYRLEPGPESAHKLGILFILRNENGKAIAYLKEAVQGEAIDAETKAQWYYELALLSLSSEKHCEAIGYAREAIGLKEDFSAAYILLGDAYIASRDNLGDDFRQRTAFWAAADKYRKAVLTDPSVEEQARQRLNASLEQYPDPEDVFFQDLKDGETYLVGGCINEKTTVQSGP